VWSGREQLGLGVGVEDKLTRVTTISLSVGVASCIVAMRFIGALLYFLVFCVRAFSSSLS
jgi:hypothetical protein